MDANELFNQINSAYRGSDDDVPAIDTPDFDLWKFTANRKIMEWARDRKNKWSSLWEVRDVGAVAAGTQVYELEDEILYPSDKVTVTTVSGNERSFVLIKPQERFDTFRSVYISGRDPQTLTFVSDFQTDDDTIGGTIRLGAYWAPDLITGLSSTIPVDDPYWLVYATASELAFNDLTYESKTVDLNNKANNLYTQMAQANRSGTYDNPRKVPTNTANIPRYNTYGWRSYY